MYRILSGTEAREFEPDPGEMAFPISDDRIVIFGMDDGEILDGTVLEMGDHGMFTVRIGPLELELRTANIRHFWVGDLNSKAYISSNMDSLAEGDPVRLQLIVGGGEVAIEHLIRIGGQWACPNCGYTRQVIPRARCPDCGNEIELFPYDLVLADLEDMI